MMRTIDPKKLQFKNLVLIERLKLMKKYGDALKDARTNAEMTPQQLADAIGVKTQCISEMEEGRRIIKIDIALKLAEVLDVNYKVFL